MDNSDTPKARRPLPTPGAVPATQRPSTPVLTPTPISPASFYGNAKPPPLPSRPKNPGSSHTAYVAPPPQYDSIDNSPEFREPELVADTTMEDQEPPPLIPPTDTNNWSGVDVDNSAWSTAGDAWENTTSDWQATSTTYWPAKVGSVTTTGYDALGYASSNLDQNYPIDGRGSYEEMHWWNSEERARSNRPGPGVLPPILADELHDPNHSLFSVNITSTPPYAPVNPSADHLSPGHATSSSIESAPPPSEEEVRTSIPHPNAYYCPKDNGWVILSWKASSVPPPLAQSYVDSSGASLPDSTRRRRHHSCLDDAGHGKDNKTHHFHKYSRAIDSHKLTPPFKHDDWREEAVKQRRRAGTILPEDVDVRNVSPPERESSSDQGSESSDDQEGILLDLYVCCQCCFYCVASGVIEGVIPRKFIDELVRDKKAHPMLGKTAEQSVNLACETLLTAIENKLWKANNRQIKTASAGFQTKLGWSPNVKRIFEALGFAEEASDRETTLRPPSTDPSTVAGKQNRRRLLRAWLEINAWLLDLRRINASHFKDAKDFKNYPYVQLDSCREMYQTAIGAHPDQIPRGGFSENVQDTHALEEDFRNLGLTPTTASTDFVVFAYLAQCRCDPAMTPKYFTSLTNIVKHLQIYGTCPTQLQELLAMEQSRDRFTLQDVTNAATSLGFGIDNVLAVEYDEEIPDEFVENAWRDCVKRSWRDQQHGSETHRLANEAFKILAESRGSVNLRKAWEAGKNKYMNPDRAYDTLEIPKDTEDQMLITVYNMRIEETPSQLEKMREAMTVIAEVRDSERLRQFLSSGMDPGEVVAPTRPDFPRGLNQLGNTCYLNSLLQYFYTIKDLREAVLPMSKLDLKALEDEKLTDEDLKKHRVGGRLVTRREIIRSRKFINQLADLFFNLEYSENPAVTPTLELAKLALVTSRDEEEDEFDKGGTDSSNDTDATLVDDAPRVTHTALSKSPQSPQRSSVLGKRPRDLEKQDSSMDVDSPISQSPKEKDGFGARREVGSPLSEAASNRNEASSSKLPEVDADGDTKMKVVTAPPKPAKKRTEVNDSTMMFGKQHDVAECMDNCMFQIETALLRFDDTGDDTDKTSIVKSLFYGKIRQRLTGADAQQSRPSIHEKEDLFSHLPVNVTDDGVDIYDGLSGYFDDVVEFEGRKARMEVTLVELPPVLQIQLQRVQFNRETLQPYKSQAYVKFGENIYMDRFLDTANPEKRAKSKAIQTELSSCRERVRLLVNGKDSVPFTSSLEHTRAYLSGLQSSTPGIDSDVLLLLDQEKTRLNEEIDRLRARINVLKSELEDVWADCTEAAYELTSVFIHRGSSPSWGHYFFYSRHLPESPDSWFKYNDSDVSVVSKEEVLADTTGSTANPYLLVFARKGANVVDTVKRFDPTMLDSP
ncbi:cysteine proteinase [Agrocybe pediades]|nr:cysteine proteinase [Agrocybe pediades]